MKENEATTVIKAAIEMAKYSIKCDERKKAATKMDYSSDWGPSWKAKEFLELKSIKRFRALNTEECPVLTLVKEEFTEEEKAYNKAIKNITFIRSEGKSTGDGFKAHYSKELGGWIGSRGKFDAECKARGYECAGTASSPQHKEAESEGVSDSDIKDLKDEGVELSGGEADFLKSV